MVRTRRTRGGFQPAVLKTPLQAARDESVLMIGTNWLNSYSYPNEHFAAMPKKKEEEEGKPKKKAKPPPKSKTRHGNDKRLSKKSRGIKNTTEPSAFRCYQSSVYQAMMHQPVFLNWIITHNEPQDPSHGSDNCAKCQMKELVLEYWGPTDPEDPIPEEANMLTRMQSIAEGANAEFRTGWYGDADDFYNFLIDSMDDQTDVNWSQKFEALYKFDTTNYFRCRTCNNEDRGPSQSANGFQVDVNPNLADLNQAISHYFSGDELDRDCTKCKVPRQRHDRIIRIEAAPQVLKVKLVIFGYTDNLEEIKFYQDLGLHEYIDLTSHQTNPALGLRYRLSSVIAHGGTGGLLQGDDGPPPVDPTRPESGSLEENLPESGENNGGKGADGSAANNDATEKENDTSRSKSTTKGQSQRANTSTSQSAKGKRQAATPSPPRSSKDSERASSGSQRNNKRDNDEGLVPVNDDGAGDAAAEKELEKETSEDFVTPLQGRPSPTSAPDKSERSESPEGEMTGKTFVDQFVDGEHSFIEGTIIPDPMDEYIDDNISERSRSPSGVYSTLESGAERGMLRGGAHPNNGPQKRKAAPQEKTNEPSPKRRKQARSPSPESSESQEDESQEEESQEDENVGSFPSFVSEEFETYEEDIMEAETNGSLDGHYIASVRGQESNFYMINDSTVRTFGKPAELWENPQRPPIGDPAFTPYGYQVFVLTYLKTATARGRGHEVESLVTDFKF